MQNPTEWRKLRFESVDACIQEVQRILDADQQGQLHATGSWTPGQVLAHVAAWIDYAYDGFPIKPPPRVIRWILRLRLKKMLDQGMPRGVRIPGVKDGTTGAEALPTAEAGRRLLAALARLSSAEPAPHESPAFGALSHADRIRLNLRHAELHLGYLTYEPVGTEP
ncbi:MAG: DUF1569 domain-containing protein [Planctomycetes bacterium]|nr:DUF1569 domain-containing protein [Planctomycetota bacterium]